MRRKFSDASWKKRWHDSPPGAPCGKSERARQRSRVVAMSTSLTLTQQEKADWINVPPVFIVGCARSGTTLLRLMLSAHPRISISSEGAYIYHLRSKLSTYGDLS